MVTSGWLIFAAILVLVLLLFAGLVWLFVLLSRGRMQPRQEAQTFAEQTPTEQTPPAKGSPAKGPPVEERRPRR